MPEAAKQEPWQKSTPSFKTMRFATCLRDNNRPFSVKHGSREDRDTSHGMIKSMKKFIVSDNVKRCPVSFRCFSEALLSQKDKLEIVTDLVDLVTRATHPAY